MFWGEFIQDVSKPKLKRKNRTSREAKFGSVLSHLTRRLGINPYHVNPPPRRLGKINHRFKTRYFFLWFLLYNIYVRVFAPLHAPGGGVAMPSLSEGNLDLKRGYLDHGFPPNPKSVVYNQKVLNPNHHPPRRIWHPCGAAPGRGKGMNSYRVSCPQGS